MMYKRFLVALKSAYLHLKAWVCFDLYFISTFLLVFLAGWFFSLLISYILTLGVSVYCGAVHRIVLAIMYPVLISLVFDMWRKVISKADLDWRVLEDRCAKLSRENIELQDRIDRLENQLKDKK